MGKSVSSENWREPRGRNPVEQCGEVADGEARGLHDREMTTLQTYITMREPPTVRCLEGKRTLLALRMQRSVQSRGHANMIGLWMMCER